MGHIEDRKIDTVDTAIIVAFLILLWFGHNISTYLTLIIKAHRSSSISNHFKSALNARILEHALG